MSLLYRMSLSSKFLVLGLLALATIALPTTLYLQRTSADIATAQHPVDGATSIIALQKVIQLVQNHRGLAADVLGRGQSLSAPGKDNVLAARMPAMRETIATAVAALDAQLASVDAPERIVAGWEERKERWTELAADAESARLQDVDESFQRHTGLIGSLLELSEDMRDEFGLALIPERASNALGYAAFVHAPWLAETLGRMRATGTTALAQQYVSDARRAELTNLMPRVAERLDEAARSLDKAFAANEPLRGELEAQLSAVRENVGQSLLTIDDKLIDALQIDFASKDYYDTLAAAIGSVYALDDAATKSLIDLLRSRVSELQRTEYLVAGLLALVVALSLGLSVAFVRSVTVPVREAVELAQAIAEGDLGRELDPRGNNEIGRLVQALGAMRQNLAGVVSEVRRHAQGVATASAQIAQGGSTLSSRTEEAASALEETAASMEQLGATARQNADNAHQADELANSASANAIDGGAVVGEVVDTMRGINDSSKRIAEIVNVIDGIAFQTNILALNAAVEAARAGEQGRGFAVVASEVRNLAQRSAEAAREIKAMIDASVERVEAGTRQVDHAGKTVAGIVESIGRVTEIVSQISKASAEQSAGFAQVGEAVSEMDRATQQNAALVEESAAAAAMLQEQAQDLVRAVAVFRLGETGPADDDVAQAAAQPQPRKTGTAAPDREDADDDELQRDAVERLERMAA